MERIVVVSKNRVSVRGLVLIGLSVALSFPSLACADGTWVPKPDFSVKESNYLETLTFVSGLAYAFSYSDKALRAARKENFFCIDEDQVIDSKLTIDLLNEELDGDYSSEVVTEALVRKLKNRFPCNPRLSVQ